MDHTTRTIIFGVVAVVAVSMGFATSIWVEPRDPDKFSDEGQPFFPDFSDPFKAGAIEVSVFDQASSTPEKFRVEYKDDLWRIPSHFDYPADGADQLGKTAASVIGITRDSLESLTKDDHEEMGVVDPLDEEIASGEGRGTRVTLFEGEVPLVDYIIGRRAEGEQNRYYIRKADEERTYLAQLQIDLSTRFTDWVEPDLLDVERNDIVNLYIDDYSLVETILPDGSPDLDIQAGETVRLHRESGGFQWTLDGLDAATETLKTGVVNAMLTALDDLKFIGVRPKPDFFEGVLRGELQVSSTDLSLVARSLQAKGYYLTRANAEGAIGLFSKEGSLVAGTADGVSYQLLVGNVFVGTQNEIEIGGDSESEEMSEPVEEADPATDASTEEPEEELPPGEQRSRYLFILTSFDVALLGPKPEPPVMPTPPGEPTEGATETEDPEQTTDEEAATGAEAAADAATEAEAVDDEASDEAAESTEEATEPDTEDAEAEAPQCDDPATTDEPAADDTATETDAAAVDDPAPETEPTDESATDATAVDDPAATDDEASEAEPAIDDAADTTDAEAEAPVAPTAEELQAAYETAMQEYDTAMRQYERDLEDYNERVAAGQKKVEELRERFAEWYYVIPADVFEDLDVSRADLVGPKTEDPAAGGGFEGIPDFNLPGFPGLPEGHPEIPELPTPDDSNGEATDPTTETPDGEETTEESPAATDEEATESAVPEATPETPEAEASQSSESDESPTGEPDSESEAPTMP